MPIFRYHCRDCGEIVEVLLRRHDETAQCPSCGSEELDKLPTTFATLTSRANACGAIDHCPSASGHCCSGGNCGCRH